MGTLIINNEEHKYIGEPLVVFMLSGGVWGGNSNFLSKDSKKKKQRLLNIQHCFRCMNDWTKEEGYTCGYILDYAKKIVYYDTMEAYFHLTNRVFPKRNLENYFEQFIKRDFTE